MYFQAIRIKQPYTNMLLLALLVGLSAIGSAQTPLSSVDLSRIRQKKVRSLVRNQQLLGIKYFSDLTPSCFAKQDSNSYKLLDCTQTIKGKAQRVWRKIKGIRLKDQYCGPMVSMGFLYSGREDRLFYTNDEFPSIEEDQIVFLNLRLLHGIRNLAVALKVTCVDDANKTIDLCYLNHGMSEGTQQIRLIEDTNGNTIISQRTRYRNRSKFREKMLYPFFHRRAINELHSILKRLIEGGQEPTDCPEAPSQPNEFR